MDAVAAIFARLEEVRWFAAAGSGPSDQPSELAARDYARWFDAAQRLRWAAGWDEARQIASGLDDESSPGC